MELKREMRKKNSNPLEHSVISSRDLGHLSHSISSSFTMHELINGRDAAGENSNSKEDSIHTIVFTAGTFLLMVCLKRFLVEQWRAWVFLLLNVILLAIVFMSMKPSYWDRSSKSSENSESESKVDEVKNDNEEEKEIEEEEKQCCNSCTHEQVLNETEEEEEEEVQMLSKEELNERVEAFIAMFRKHLISDVKQAESFRLIEVPCC